MFIKTRSFAQKSFVWLVMLGLILSNLGGAGVQTVQAQAAGEIFVDPLYGYNVTIPSGWSVDAPEISALSTNKIRYGVTLIENFDTTIAGESNPEDIKIQIGLGPMTNPDFFDWTEKRIWNETKSSDFIDFHYNATNPEPISLGSFNGYKFITTSQDLNSSVMEIDLLVRNDLVVSIGLTPSDSPSIPAALTMLSTLDFSDANINIQDFYDNSRSVVSMPELVQPNIVEQQEQLQTLTIHSPGWGGEAPNSPITLYMPFHDGETWQVGGGGNFYGDGDHTNSFNDYYATDWNRTAGDDFGKDVLPVANGNIIANQSLPCPTSGFGCYVKIDHGNGITTLYGHLSAVSRTSGGVNHWDVIGQVGSSGNSTGAHLHLRFRLNNFSTCQNNGNTCPNGEAHANQQSPKPSPMNTQQGAVQLNDSYTYTSNNKNDGGGTNNCQNTGGSGVRLYDGTLCTTPPERYYSSPGFANVSDFNDVVSSINVGDGWSVRVYENNDRGGSSRCITGDMWDLGQDYYTSGNTGKLINNDISSIDVFNNSSCTGNPAPSAPSLNTPGNGSNNPYNYNLNFQWNSSSGATEYLLEWWGGPYSTMQPCGWSSSTSCAVGTVAAGNTYSWHVKARNGSGESGWSDTWTFTVQSQAQPPSTPSLSSPGNGSSNPYNYDLNFQWNSSSGGTEYLVEWWGGPYSTMQPCGWSSSTSCHIGTVVAGNTYSWHVKARNGAGESGWSSTWAFTIQSQSLPVSAEFDTWPPSGDAPFTTALHIVDMSNITSCSWNYGDGQTSTTCTQLHNHTYNNPGLYTVSLTVNGPGTSDYTIRTDYINVSDPSAPPDMPSDPAVTDTTTDSLTLTWQDNSNTENGFNIYRWGYDGTDWTFIYLDSVGADTTSYTQTGLACGSDFNFYEVSAYNINGESQHAGWVQGTTSACLDSELSIASLTVDPASAYTNDNTYVGVNVQNSSNVDASGFWIDVYIDSQPTQCAAWGSYYVWINNLAANASDTFWVEIPAGDLAAGSHNIYAFVDSGCAISESNEDNNFVGPGSLSLTTPPTAPVHDDFDFGKLISPISYSDSVSVSGATLAFDDPAVSVTGCDLQPGLASVWYKYTPSANTRLNLDTFGSDYDTYIAVWTGSRGNLTPISCNDDESIGNTVQSNLQVDLTAGTTYFIEVAQYNGVLTSSALGIIPRIQPRPGEEIQSKSNTGKSTSLATPKPGADITALAGGLLNFHASAITYTISGNAGVAGATLSYTDGAAKTATADGSGNYSFTVSYNWSGTVTPTKTGYTFIFATTSYHNVLANQTAQNYTATASSNDDFSNPQLITSLPYTMTQDTTGTSTASDDPYLTGCGLDKRYHSVWYRFTPSSSGIYAMDTLGSGYDTVLGVWRGSRGALASVGCNDDAGGRQSLVSASLVGGQIYYIEIVGYNSTDFGSLILHVHATVNTPFLSVGTQDGFVLETSEKSNLGGSLNATSVTFNLGDDAVRRQYRSILSFSTGSLPDNAIITGATLKVQKQGILGGGNPVAMFQGFMVDIKNGFFGTAALQASDFQTAGNTTYGPATPGLVGAWYSIDLTSVQASINKLSTSSGMTQIRLRFKLDDNNNAVANILSLYSGNAPAANRPQLIITYYVP